MLCVYNNIPIKKAHLLKPFTVAYYSATELF